MLQKSFNQRLFAALCVVIVVSSACTTPNKNAPKDTAVAIALPAATAIESTEASDSPVTSGLTEAAPAVTTESTTAVEVGPSATPLPEIDWREVPIMPTLSEHVLEIYRAGRAQGRDPQHFSVIGDCQAIPFVFMGPYERGELIPDESDSYLWDAIGYFKGSFVREGMAVRGGFTAASLLSPIQADPHSCKPGETPLTCEYRLYNPAYVFITLEIWNDEATVGRYEQYLRKIVDYVIERGSIPILLTKADAWEAKDGSGKHTINPAIVQVAREYDVPVVNFWKAAQFIENHGLDPSREGFHLSQEGYNLKNKLALRTLYQVWQTTETGTLATTTSTEPAAQTQPTATAVSQTAFTRPDCASGNCLFFGVATSRDGVVQAGGIYAYDNLNQKLTQMLGEGYDLQDVTADGQHLLINQDNNLYELDLTTAEFKLISSSFVALGKQGAYFNTDDSTVTFIDQNELFSVGNDAAFNTFPPEQDETRYIEIGTCTSKDFCQSAGVYRVATDQTTTRLETYSHLAFSLDGTLVALLNPQAATRANRYHIGRVMFEQTSRGLASRRVIQLPPATGFLEQTDVRTFAFSPQSDRLYIVSDIYSDYYERSVGLKTYLFDLKTSRLHNLESLEGAFGSLNPRLAWSPPGDSVLVMLMNLTPDNQYTLSLYRSDLKDEGALVPHYENLITSPDYFYITNLYWR